MSKSGSRFVTLGEVLSQTKEIGRGFDTLRVLLSIAILCWHSIATSYGREAELPVWSNPVTAGLVAALLPVFFALSGFLVMGSAVRTMSLKVFLAARGLRILPALSTEIAVSAIILGGSFTTLSARDYFTSAGFFKYFGSLAGCIQFSLPGVFTHNPFDDVVNGSLWTIAPELFCYTYISIIIAVNLLDKVRALTALVVVATLVLIMSDALGFNLRHFSDSFKSHTLILSFAIGNVIYLWRNYIPYSKVLFAVCLIAGVGLVGYPHFSTLSLPFLAYVTVYLGLLPLPKIPVLQRGDYSYGIYLYAMPVQQSFAFLFPEFRQWYWNILVSLPLTIGLAMFSWNFIEKPALRLRKHLTDSAEHRANKRGSMASPATIAVIVSYGLWLCATRYTVPLISAHLVVTFAAIVFAAVLVSGVLTRVEWYQNIRRLSAEAYEKTSSAVRNSRS